MNIKQKIKIYIINLEKHEDRKNYIINEVNKIN